ncbi:hypothetical protein AVEN_159030-1 [Araneus ventricosus]|uniref:Uncharacterized protein n=1 Tax=Araneus ventricosus TaxID=182803 RepID=A0A4Y2B9B1_ARAVE|nr:hypothetical protein AVEN_159030-1 [Araneus ventricosus]
MSSSRRSCVDHLDVFCYICGEYTLKKTEKLLVTLKKELILDTLVLGLVIRIKPGHRIRSVKLVQNIYDSELLGKEKSEIGVPMVWREQKTTSMTVISA